jgi:hypothetical protein
MIVAAADTEAPDEADTDIIAVVAGTSAQPLMDTEEHAVKVSAEPAARASAIGVVRNPLYLKTQRCQPLDKFWQYAREHAVWTSPVLRTLFDVLHRERNTTGISEARNRYEKNVNAVSAGVAGKRMIVDAVAATLDRMLGEELRVTVAQSAAGDRITPAQMGALLRRQAQRKKEGSAAATAPAAQKTRGVKKRKAERNAEALDTEKTGSAKEEMPWGQKKKKPVVPAGDRVLQSGADAPLMSSVSCGAGAKAIFARGAIRLEELQAEATAARTAHAAAVSKHSAASAELDAKMAAEKKCASLAAAVAAKDAARARKLQALTAAEKAVQLQEARQSERLRQIELPIRKA